MKPIISDDGTPLLSPSGIPLLGDEADCVECCDSFNGCVSCECFDSIAASDIKLIVSAAPLTKVNTAGPSDDNCGFIENLMGIRTLQAFGGCLAPSGASLCEQSCFADLCALNTPTILGFHYAASGIQPYAEDFEFDPLAYTFEDCSVWDFVWRARWFAHLDKVNHRLSVFLGFHFIGGVGCPAVCASRIVSYIRWEYGFNSCEQLKSPTHIRTMAWNAWGSVPSTSSYDPDDGDIFQSCLCPSPDISESSAYVVPAGSPNYVRPCGIHPNEWSASGGQYMGSVCEVAQGIAGLGQPGSPAWATHYTANTAVPEVRIEACQSDCCESGGPTASFDLDDNGTNCRFTARDTSTGSEACGPIVKRLWVLEQWDECEGGELPGNGCAERQDVVADVEEVSLVARGCGGQCVRVTLYVWDAEGCMDSVSSGIVACCNCEDANGDLCASPPCGLTITKISEEGEVPCVYRLANSGDDTGYEGVCANTAYTEVWGLGGFCVSELDPDADCTCGEMTDGNCGGDSCSIGIGPGSHTDINITAPVTIKWRCKEGSCGCGGEIHEYELLCPNCDCCEDALGSVMVTIDAIGQGDIEGCADCNAKIFGTYEVPFTGPCFAQLSIPNHFSCECDPDPCFYDLDIQVLISCDESGNIDIDASFSTSATGQIDFHRDIAAGTTPAENCLSILDGALTNTFSPGPCVGVQCDGCSATMVLDFIAA
jgi:hypothetical protein